MEQENDGFNLFPKHERQKLIFSSSETKFKKLYFLSPKKFNSKTEFGTDNVFLTQAYDHTLCEDETLWFWHTLKICLLALVVLSIFTYIFKIRHQNLS